ncbi:MAG: hypothetical protein JWN39_4098, partial [Ilumatobacteraceae bacterium]|nr:hypothetical protein [Ilumatobacteraceae bacterium]
MNDNLQRDVHQVLADIVASTPSTPLNPFVAESAADEVSW